MADAYDYRVLYQRAGWAHPQQRVYRRKVSARGLVDKLLEGRDDLAPLVRLSVWERPKGVRHGGWILRRDFAQDS